MVVLDVQQLHMRGLQLRVEEAGVVLDFLVSELFGQCSVDDDNREPDQHENRHVGHEVVLQVVGAVREEDPGCLFDPEQEEQLHFADEVEQQTRVLVHRSF